MKSRLFKVCFPLEKIELRPVEAGIKKKSKNLEKHSPPSGYEA